MNIIAVENERTIHHGRMCCIGGLAIYLTFLVCALFILKADQQINAIMISGFMIFMMGLIDDILDISPKQKLVVQAIAALIVIFYGKICIHSFNIPYMSIEFNNAVSYVITFVWIIGMTNAINLIDGLDGLCAGICAITLFTVALISLTFQRTDIALLSMILSGACIGFLFYNFHPAKLFMGDCGSEFLGFMISVISLLGFGYKSSTFFTLGAPITVLAVPIMDTLIAIVRRKLHNKKFTEADRGHLHHQLMFNLKLGQKKSVLILYGVTGLFSLSAYLYLYNKDAGFLLFIILMIAFEIFIEYTEMISRRYRPILALLNLFLKNEHLPSFNKGEDSTINLIKRKIGGANEKKDD